MKSTIRTGSSVIVVDQGEAEDAIALTIIDKADGTTKTISFDGAIGGLLCVALENALPAVVTS